jgi:hypothetical protein
MEAASLIGAGYGAEYRFRFRNAVANRRRILKPSDA